MMQDDTAKRSWNWPRFGLFVAVEVEFGIYRCVGMKALTLGLGDFKHQPSGNSLANK